MDHVAALMTKRLILVNADDDVLACALKLLDHDIRHLPVVDEDGRFVGILDDTLVFAYVGFTSLTEPGLALMPGAENLSAAELAHPADVRTQRAEALLPVLRRMLATRSDCAIVLDDERHPVGIVTEHDALRLAQALVDEKLGTKHCGTSPVASVQQDTSTSEAWSRMIARRIRHLCVVDETGVLRGVISHRDLVRDGAPLQSDTPVRELLQHQLVWSVGGDATVPEVTRWMIAGRIGCLPVVDELDRPLSVITRTDVIDALVGALEMAELFADPAEERIAP